MIDREVAVRVAPAAAFAAWTDAIGLWWPPGHRVSGDPDARMILEAGEGGRLFERATDGREVDVGRVLQWEPPRRLALAFFLGTGAAAPTHVEVRFEPSGAGTRVRILHTAGEANPERFHDTAPRFHAGWERVAQAFGAWLETP